MSKRQKCLSAICIFLVLFSGGWYANEYNLQTIHKKGLDGYQLRVQQLEEEDAQRTVPFKPREYIRILNRNAP